MANTGKLIGAKYTVARDSGSFGAPAHIPLISARDIKVMFKPAGIVDASDRVSQALVYEKSMPVRDNLEFSFNALWSNGAGLGAIRDALIAGTPIRLSLMNAPPANTTTGAGVGWRGDWLVKKGSWKFNLRGGQEVDFTLCPHGAYNNVVATYTDATTTLGTPETQGTKKIGTAASFNDSSNAPVTAIKEITLDIEWDTCDATDRSAAIPDQYDLYMPTRLKINVGLTFQWKEDDTQIVLFRTRARSKAEYLGGVLDGAYTTSGSWGVSASGGVGWAITDFPSDANLTDAQLHSCKLQPHGNYTVAPAFQTI